VDCGAYIGSENHSLYCTHNLTSLKMCKHDGEEIIQTDSQETISPLDGWQDPLQ